MRQSAGGAEGWITSPDEAQPAPGAMRVCGLRPECDRASSPLVAVNMLMQGFFEHVTQGYLLQGLQVRPAFVKNRFRLTDELVRIAIQAQS